jgi:hypothetical protein
MSDDEMLSLSQSQSQEDDMDDEDYFPPSNSDSSIISGCSEVNIIELNIFLFMKLFRILTRTKRKSLSTSSYC